MAALTITIELPSDVDATHAQARFDRANKRRAMVDIAEYIEAIVSGVRRARVLTQVASAFATQTVTCDQSAAIDGTDDITIAAGATTQTLSVEAAPASEDEFAKGSTDAGFATNLAAAINGHSTLSRLVEASASAAVVTIQARAAGAVGNGITLAETGVGFTLGAANLASGAHTTIREYEFGLT